MAGQIDFSLLRSPNFLGDALAYQEAGRKQHDDEALHRARATGDIGALRTLAPDEAAAMEKAQVARDTRAAQIAGATAAAKGDWQGAKTAYAGAGDIGAVNDVDTMHAAQTKKVADEAQYLQGVLAQQGPQAMLAAYDQRAATYGGSPDQIAQIRQALVQDPAKTLGALAGAPSYQYQKSSDGSIIAVNPATTEAKTIYQGEGTDLKRAQNAEQERHNRAMEDIGRTNAGANVTRAAKTGGRAVSALPPPPAGWSRAGQ